MNLKEWAQIFLKQRDIIKKEIMTIDENPKGYLITTKSGEERIILVNEELGTEKANTHICLNKKQNVEILINAWETFAKQEETLIVFASPKTHEKWLIKPHHHNKISDPESLKQGLLAMHDAISKA